jgi:lysophospholipase L1-like esterase
LYIFINDDYYSQVQFSSLAFTVALPTGSKVVDIVAGLQTKPSATILGTFPMAVRFIGGDGIVSLISPDSPIDRICIYGDSISCGGNADNPGDEAWSVLLRQTVPVIHESYGWRTLFADCPDAAGRTTFAAKVASYAPGSVLLTIGTNDYGLNTQSAADFGTAYADLLDKLHAVLENITLYCMSPIGRSSEVANSFGDTLGAYRTEISTAAAARDYCTYLAGTDILPYSAPYFSADGLHPNTAGHALMLTNIKLAIGL